MDLSITLPTNIITEVPDPNPRRPFLTPLHDPGHFLLVLDNTALDRIKRCHLAARNYLILGREPHAKDAALVFGGAVHVGIEHFLRGASEDVGAAAVVDYFTKHPCPADEYRTPATAVEVVKHYRRRSSFPDYEWDVKSDEKGLLVEQAFELPLGVLEVEAELNCLDGSKPRWIDRDAESCVTELRSSNYVKSIHLCWSGRIDAIAFANDRVRVVDHKTTKIAGDQFIQAFQLASQTRGYVWAARQLWPDLDISGFCLNAIHLTPPAKGQGLLDKGPRGGKPPLDFFRSYFNYTEASLRSWRESTVCLIEDFIHSLVRDYFPQNDSQCFNKFGRCAYFDTCTEDDPELRDRMLQSSMFKPVTWNPTADR